MLVLSFLDYTDKEKQSQSYCILHRRNLKHNAVLSSGVTFGEGHSMKGIQRTKPKKANALPTCNTYDKFTKTCDPVTRKIKRMVFRYVSKVNPVPL